MSPRPEHPSFPPDPSRPSYADAMYWMAQQIPEFSPMLTEHLAAHDELLTYLVFEGDYMRWLKGQELHPPDDQVLTFLRCVEMFFQGPPDDLANLASIGFAENLVLGGELEHEVLAALRPHFGPATESGVSWMEATHAHMGALNDAFGECRCEELNEVVDGGALFYVEHMVWQDELRADAKIYRCPETKSVWLLTTARMGGPLRVVRHPNVEAARRAAGED